WVLLLSLPLTPKLPSTNFTVRLVSHVSLKPFPYTTLFRSHWMVASAGQLATVGALLSITVIVWVQVPDLVCSSVAVQVRCVLLTPPPLTPRLPYTTLFRTLVSHVSLKTGVPKAGVAGHSMVASAG